MFRVPILHRYSNILKFEPEHTELHSLSDSFVIVQYNKSFLSVCIVNTTQLALSNKPIEQKNTGVFQALKLEKKTENTRKSESYKVKYLGSIKSVVYLHKIMCFAILHEKRLSLFDIHLNKINLINKVTEVKTISFLCLLFDELNSQSDVLNIRDCSLTGECNLFIETTTAFVLVTSTAKTIYEKKLFEDQLTNSFDTHIKCTLIDFGCVNGIPVFIYSVNETILIFQENRLVGNLKGYNVQIVNNKLYSLILESSQSTQSDKEQISNTANSSVIHSEVISLDGDIKILVIENATNVHSQVVYSYNSKGMCNYIKNTVVTVNNKNPFIYETKEHTHKMKYQINFPYFDLLCNETDLLLLPETPYQIPTLRNDLSIYIRLVELEKQKQEVDKTLSLYNATLFTTYSIDFSCYVADTLAYMLTKDASTLPLEFISLMKCLSLSELCTNQIFPYTLILEQTKELNNDLVYWALITKKYEDLVFYLSNNNSCKVPEINKVKIAISYLILQNEKYKNEQQIIDFVLENISEVMKNISEVLKTETKRTISDNLLIFLRNRYNKISANGIKYLCTCTSLNLPYLIFKDITTCNIINEEYLYCANSAADLLFKCKRKDLCSMVLYKLYKINPNRATLHKIIETIEDYVFIDDFRFISKEMLY